MNDKLKHTEPHWDDTRLVVHVDEVRAAMKLLPPDVEMRVNSILDNAPDVRAPGFMLAFTIGTGPYDLTDRDLACLLEALQGLGYDPGSAPERADEPDPSPADPAVDWQTENYTPAEGAELAQLIYDTGLLTVVNAAALHFHGLALGVTLDDDGSTVIGLNLHRTSDPEGVWYDEDLTRRGRQKLLKAGVILGSRLPSYTAPARYQAAQEARERAAAVSGTPEGAQAATAVELGELKTLARDKGWDLAYEWIVSRQEDATD